MTERGSRKQSNSANDESQQQKQLAAARQFAIDAARHAANTRCTNVVVLDLTGLSPVCDFFVIATGTSARQMRTVADEINELAEQRKFSPMSSSGYEGESWILVDCVDVVVHIFNAQTRGYYDLDNLWGDAKPIDWQTEATKS